MSERTTPRPGQERFVAPLDETPLQEVDAVDMDKVPESQWKEVWGRLRKSGLFWFASAILLVLAVMIAFPTLFTSADPNYKQLSDSLEPARDGAPFGFDKQGGNVWARTVYGARASVAVGVLSTLIVAVVGIITGAIAGYYGKVADTLLSRTADIFFSIPLLLASIVIISVINNLFPDRGFWGSVIVIVLALGAFAWPQITRQMRGAVLEVKNLEFVDAATAIGASRWTNLTRHIIPNSLAPVIVTLDHLAGRVHRGRVHPVLPRSGPAQQRGVVGQRPRRRPGAGARWPAPDGHVGAGVGLGHHGARLHPAG